MAAFKYAAPDAGTTLLSAGLNSLTTGSRAISSTVADNRDTYGDFELVFQFGTAPAADAPIYVYFVKAPDGTNFEDGSGSVTPSAQPDIVFTSRAVNTAQRQVRYGVRIPVGDFQVLLVSQAGQTMAASGNTLKMWRYNVESV